MPTLLHAQQIKTLARHLGFHACGLTAARPVDGQRAAAFRQWLAEGRQADMHYLENHLEKRLDPRLLVPGAQTIVSLAVNYYTPDEMGDSCTSSSLPSEGENVARPDEYAQNRWTLARYARGTDYHEVVKTMLRQLMAAMHLEEGTDGRCFVDTAPIDEKYWAQQCGLGWKGRNSQLIIPGAGSYFFLGELVLVHEADAYDRPMPSRCGTCRRCLDACPAHALLGNGELDARRCLSYLTIEHRGPLPDGTGSLMGNCFYGCDRCNDACPWNHRFASPTTVPEFLPRPSILSMTPDDWQHLTVDQYRSLFRQSAVKRAKFEGLMRNVQAITESTFQPEYPQRNR